MYNVGIDLSCLDSGHKFRGIGSYAQNLWEKLSKHSSPDLNISPYQQGNQYDLIHIPAFNPFFFSLPFSQLNKAIITIHDLIPIQYKSHYPPGLKGNLKWYIQKLALNFARHIITDSHSAKQVIIELTGLSSDKISVVYLAASSNYYPETDQYFLSAVKQKYHLPDKFILYVGDFNWNKQVINLAKVCSENNLPLYVVGKQATSSKIDPHHPWNQPLVQFQKYAHKHQDTIHLLGYLPHDELRALYNLATVFTLPSIEEGFGLPILEAMACGCPVLCGDRSSMLEIAGTAAELFNPQDMVSLKRKLRLLFSDSKRRLELSRSGINRSNEFSWQKTAQQTIQIYQKCLS